MHAPVAPIALLARVATEWQLFPVTDRGQSIRGHTQRDEVILDGLGALGTERQVVLDRAPLVTVPFDLGTGAFVLFQPLAVGGENVARTPVKLVRIVREVQVLQDAAFFGTETALVATETAACVQR